MTKMLDKRECWYCGSIENIEVDHIIARSKGGSNSPKNLRDSCRPCNLSKGKKSVEEFRNHLVLKKIGVKFDEVQKEFLLQVFGVNMELFFENFIKDNVLPFYGENTKTEQITQKQECVICSMDWSAALTALEGGRKHIQWKSINNVSKRKKS